MAEKTEGPGGRRVTLNLNFQLFLSVLTGVHHRELAVEGGAGMDKARILYNSKKRT